MTFIDDWRARAPQAIQALAGDLGCTPDMLTTEQRAAALLWAIRDRIRAGDSIAFGALRSLAGDQADALLISIAAWPPAPRAAAEHIAARAAANPALRAALEYIVAAFDPATTGPTAPPADGMHYHFDAVQAGAFAPGGSISIEQLTVRQGGVASPPPPLPSPETVAAGQALLATLPTGDDTPIPQPATFPLAARMQIQSNPLFVGRDTELRALADQLKLNGGAVAVTTGIGGVGKTQLAAEFAHRYGQFFAGGVFWVSFANPAAIAGTVAAYGSPGALELFRPEDQLTLDQRKDRVQAQWASPLPRLLVFDNCDDSRGDDGGRISGEALLREWRPPSGGCRVLITSRRANWSLSLGVSARELHTLQRPASGALLQRLAPALSDADAGALADALGDLPLALFLAGNYMHKYSRAEPPARYIERLRGLDILAHPSMEGRGTSDVPTERKPHVARAFALSYDRLDPADSVDALAIPLLARAARLAPGEPFPRDLLAATVAVAGDEAALQAIDAIDRLLDLGLIEPEADDTLRIHRLISAYVQRTAPAEGAQEAVEDALTDAGNRMVNAGIPARLLTIVAHLRHTLIAADPRGDARAASLANAAARAEQALTNYAAARPLFERALAIREQALGPTHPDTATSLNNLAELFRAQGDYAAARPLYQRALTIYEQALGPTHPDTATSLNNLALLLESQGDYAAARPLYQRALSIYEQALGPTHPVTATSLNNLALLHYAQGDYAAARPLYERALTIREHVLGPSHPDTASSLNNLAVLHYTQGDYAAARPLYQRALTIREHVLGPSHPDTASSLNNLAGLFRAQGDYAAARRLYQRALSIREQALGPSHPDTASSLNNLAVLFRAQGDYAAARPLYERALQVTEQALGPSHPDTASSLNNLAVLHYTQGDYAAARPLYQRALAIREQALGPSHPDTAQSLNNLALLLESQGDFDRAIPLIERALAIRVRVLGSQHPDTIRTQASLENIRAAAARQHD